MRVAQHRPGVSDRADSERHQDRQRDALLLGEPRSHLLSARLEPIEHGIRADRVVRRIDGRIDQHLDRTALERRFQRA
jgi:hypothetical protein